MLSTRLIYRFFNFPWLYLFCICFVFFESYSYKNFRKRVTSLVVGDPFSITCVIVMIPERKIENLYLREKKSAKVNMRNVIPYYGRKQCGDFKCQQVF